MGRARQMLMSRSYGLLQICYGRLFYSIKYTHNKWNGYWSLKKSIKLIGNSKIGIHHSTMCNIKNSKIIVNNGSLKVGVDYGYFDGGGFDSSKDNCRISLHNSTLEIEGDVTLYAGVTINGINAKIVIKHGTAINGGTQIIALSDIEIGQNCMIAQGVIIRDNDGHKLSTEANAEVDMGIEKVRIGNHCWLGQRSMILKDVILQDNVIVAAGAVVTKSVDANNLVAGVPAKILKENVKWGA
ncbi:MAG TPA: acyltransferase [Bacteroidia bacterium]|nr:acyltransferase [Bacteroidia bacterium]